MTQPKTAHETYQLAFATLMFATHGQIDAAKVIKLGAVCVTLAIYGTQECMDGRNALFSELFTDQEEMIKTHARRYIEAATAYGVQVKNSRSW